MDKLAKLEKEIAKTKNPTKGQERVFAIARAQVKWQDAMTKVAPDIQAAKDLIDSI